MSQDFFHWIQKQPERIELDKKREKLQKEWQESDRQARITLRMSFAYQACAEKIEDSIVYWQCSSESDDDTMHKIYGFHPELAVDDQADVMKSLKQQAFEKAAEAAAHNKAARSSEQAWTTLGSEYGKQWEALKPKWEALQTEQAKKEEKN
jgi:ABC-type Fe3+/spermidine/putrescine transport system ATPase subunit|tara:strand:- start:188 stop:640 length:453 start_codon:yes stop_codon:yes gene_type:complete